MNARSLRREFTKGFWFGLQVVWPILSLLLFAIAGLGLAVGWLEGWRVQDSIYFAFVTGLTIGYGDFSPESLVGRILAMLIGACGILLTGFVAAIAVKALTSVAERRTAGLDRDT